MFYILNVALMFLVFLLKKPTFVRCVTRSWIWCRTSILGLEWNKSTLFSAQMVIHLVGPPMASLDLKVDVTYECKVFKWLENFCLRKLIGFL